MLTSLARYWPANVPREISGFKQVQSRLSLTTYGSSGLQFSFASEPWLWLKAWGSRFICKIKTTNRAVPAAGFHETTFSFVPSSSLLSSPPLANNKWAWQVSMAGSRCTWEPCYLVTQTNCTFDPLELCILWATTNKDTKVTRDQAPSMYLLIPNRKVLKDTPPSRNGCICLG